MSDLRGIWRNDHGGILRVTHPFTGSLGGYAVLGHVWVALPEGRFGRAAWLVTEDGLKTGGYQRIGENDECDAR